ncbi:MAG: hypothetical protein GXO26_09220 [Crenarchaeota archaeon]|nr:hypothetical protein [Thermoproteota archaeon]
MSARKKKKSFLIIALVAIIIAEAGYILASFGLFSLSRPRQRVKTLDAYIDIICRLAGGTKDICEGTVFRTLSSYPNYDKIAIRVIDLHYAKNTTLLRDEALYLLKIAKPLVDIFYTPTSNITRLMSNIIESINKSLDWKLNTLEYNVYTISYPKLFAIALIWSSMFPKRIYSINMKYIELKGTNVSLVIRGENSTKPRTIILISQANLTFNINVESKNIVKFLNNNLNISASELFKYGNKTRRTLMYVAYFPINVKGNVVTLNIVAMYLVNKSSTIMRLSLYSPYLNNTSIEYTLYNLTTPLVIIGDKTAGTLNCLIVNYRNLTELKELVTRCLRQS